MPHSQSVTHAAIAGVTLSVWVVRTKLQGQLSMLLAQSDEGKASEAQLNRARVAERSKWLAFYDSEHNLERALKHAQPDRRSGSGPHQVDRIR